MRHSRSAVRALSLALLAVATTVTATGCHRGARGDYALAPEMRPLEVPPDLNLPDTSGAMKLPGGDATQSVSRSSVGAAATPAPDNTGFTVAGERDAVFDRIGEVLAATDGVTIASKAQILGTYDVDYEGSKFLLRVTKVQAGAYVSAVDPRGLPASGEAPVKLVAALKAALGAG